MLVLQLYYTISVVGETYMFKEISAPSGYRLAKPVKVTIKDNDDVQKVTVKDEPIPNVPETPQTGGMMPIIPIAAGFLFAASAAVYIFRKKNSVEK